MKKILLISLVMSVMLVASVMAVNVNLVEKDSTNWNVIEGSWGKISYTNDKFSFNAHDLEAGDYTLLTYGGWTEIECFGSATVNKGGNLHLNGEYNFELTSNEPLIVPIKIWLVPTSDVNCDEHKMTAWNPTEWLFEK